MAVAGRIQTLELSSDGGTTWLKVGYLQDCTLDRSKDEIETTNKDDGQDKSFIQGHREHSITGTFIYDQADPGQQAMIDHFYSNTTLKWRWRHEVGVGKKQYVADGFVRSLSAPAPTADVQTIDFEVRLSGSVVVSTQ